MTHQGAPHYVPGLADAGGQVAQLRQLLALARQIAGLAPSLPDAALDEAARISAGYQAAAPIAQRRFDRVAQETERWAATAVETLLALKDEGRPYAPAAAELARALETALLDLSGSVSA
jgi:hypothetical protein